MPWVYACWNTPSYLPCIVYVLCFAQSCLPYIVCFAVLASFTPSCLPFLFFRHALQKVVPYITQFSGMLCIKVSPLYYTCFSGMLYTKLSPLYYTFSVLCAVYKVVPHFFQACFTPSCHPLFFRHALHQVVSLYSLIAPDCFSHLLYILLLSIMHGNIVILCRMEKWKMMLNLLIFLILMI